MSGDKAIKYVAHEPSLQSNSSIQIYLPPGAHKRVMASILPNGQVVIKFNTVVFYAPTF